MDRNTAVSILEEKYFETMSREERLEALDELWITCDSEDYFDDDEMPHIPKEIKLDMLKNDRPSNPDDLKYDFLVRDLCKGIFFGVKNEFLIKKLREFSIDVNTIVGKEEKLEACNCCNYKTIHPGEDGLCQVCPVCFWENFGEGPNNMQLKKAQENFKRFGAMDRMFLDHIDKESQLKYIKADGSH